MGTIDIVICFSGDSGLVSPLLRSLSQRCVAEELSSLDCSVIAINDSPRDADLKETLQREALEFNSVVAFTLLPNTKRLGFIRSVNQALRSAAKENRDVILLRPDAVVSPGALTELVQVAELDPMIRFMRPRSSGASICALPHQEDSRAENFSESEALFRRLAVYLPRFQFIPSGAGPCLLIKGDILQELGVLDESYGSGYAEREICLAETDLIMRANRCGYRVALANRAWIYQAAQRDAQESTTGPLDKKYPEYRPTLRRYLNGERYEAERMLSRLIPNQDGRLDLLVDFSSLGTHHNGTFVLSKAILARAARLWKQFDIHVMVSDEARRFHELDRFEGLRFVPLDEKKRFAVALRLGQPFTVEHLLRLSRLAPVNVYAMLDPIMFDCFYMNAASTDDLETLWASVFRYADGVVYISDFVRELFQNRFERRQSLRELVSYPSLDLNDYRKDLRYSAAGPEHILVIGNKSDHKRVRNTVEALNQAFPNEKIVSVGARVEGSQNIVSFVSGSLDDVTLQGLMWKARFVVYPSVYEGFGLPILESLACDKAVVARSLPVTRTIRDRISCPDNLILFSSTADLIAKLSQGFPCWISHRGHGDDSIHNWEETITDIGACITASLDIDVENVLIPRIRYMHLLGQRAHATGDSIPIFGTPREQIESIYSSWSWRLTSPMRWIGTKCLRLRKLWLNVRSQSPVA